MIIKKPPCNSSTGKSRVGNITHQGRKAQHTKEVCIWAAWHLLAGERFYKVTQWWHSDTMTQWHSDKVASVGRRKALQSDIVVLSWQRVQGGKWWLRAVDFSTPENQINLPVLFLSVYMFLQTVQERKKYNITMIHRTYLCSPIRALFPINTFAAAHRRVNQVRQIGSYCWESESATC